MSNIDENKKVMQLLREMFSGKQDLFDSLQYENNNKTILYLKSIQDHLSKFDSSIKDSILASFNHAIEITKKQYGEKYTQDNLMKNFIKLALMTDPKNKISPFELNAPTKN